MNRVQISPFGTAPGAARNHTALTGRLVLAGLALDHRRSEVTGGPSVVTVMPLAVPIDDPLPGKLQPAPAILTQFDQRLRRVPRHHSSSLMTGRVGYVRATSVNPAAENIATVPVKMPEPPTRAALRAATSTG
jgi:hypothetical protein